ncbi:hypothetical protein [Mesorhizobium sp.]|uniref:hypothetical protein n=1 Tax=Mesorhizobium sp. TaxID=1871066 RepID=UPI0025BE3F4E|nr:hypothetical protein [Mesorhizobium sp.]
MRWTTKYSSLPSRNLRQLQRMGERHGHCARHKDDSQDFQENIHRMSLSCRPACSAKSGLDDFERRSRPNVTCPNRVPSAWVSTARVAICFGMRNLAASAQGNTVNIRIQGGGKEPVIRPA